MGLFMKLSYLLAGAAMAFSVAGAALASNYPSDYCQQRIYAINNGPSLLARVGSGCTDQLAIGYKNSGVLASSQVEVIDAVVTGSCNISSAQKVTVVKLQKEWNGTGYMNKPDYTSYYPQECARDSLKKIAVAYSDGKGNWDSRYSANYNATMEDFYNVGSILSRSFGPEIGLDAWNIIINEMRK
jgi:hypothetical protein